MKGTAQMMMMISVYFLLFNETVKMEMSHATNTQAPPADLIFSSARLEKNFAFTISGCFGRIPLPNTLK